MTNSIVALVHCFFSVTHPTMLSYFLESIVKNTPTNPNLLDLLPLQGGRLSIIKPRWGSISFGGSIDKCHTLCQLCPPAHALHTYTQTPKDLHMFVCSSLSPFSMYYLYDSSVMSRSRLHAQLRTHPLNSLPVPLHTPTLQLRTSILQTPSGLHVCFQNSLSPSPFSLFICYTLPYCFTAFSGLISIPSD